MSALTVADGKGGKKPLYKDYVSFLGSYRASKKDDQCSVTTNDSGVSFSLTNSSNNSSSSVNSDLTDFTRNGFKEYLEQYNGKTYSSVQPGIGRRQNGKHEEVKTMKTEVYLEIHGSPHTVNQVSKVFKINNEAGRTSNVFKKNTAGTDTVTVKTVPPSGKVNTFMFEQKEPENHHTLRRTQRKTSIGEISKKFEATSMVPSTHKVQLKKQSSISEKTRLFEATGARNPVETKNEAPKLLQQKDDTNTLKTNGFISKPPINNIKPVLVTKTFPEPPPPSTLFVSEVKEPQSNLITIPPPPPFAIPTTQSTIIPCPPSQPPAESGTSPGVPPPPPPFPTTFSGKSHSLPRRLNGVQNGRPTQNGKQDVADGIPVPVVSKDDPRVKKLVYGALREMYGAYHDKANDYIATLPRNRVKKNNGLDSIINSIA